MQERILQRQSSKEISPTKQKSSVENIQLTKAALDDTIHELNIKLHTHFQNKEQALLDQYKRQLVEAQKQLNQLKSTTNQEQIKNKMLERKKQLERERHQLIQTNIFFSTKCEEYKKKLADLVAQGKQLERELVFLDAQIQSTTKRKYQVLSQEQSESRQPTPVQLPTSNQKQDQLSSLPLLSERKAGTSSRKLANSISVRSTNKKTLIQESMNSRVKKNMVRGEIPKAIFQKTPLQELFETTVQQVKQKRKGKKMIALKGEEFSDYQKKMIMQQFLSKEEVKKKIYEIIFETDDKRPAPYSMVEPKIKISYDDIV